MQQSFDLETLEGTIHAAKAAAKRYYELTGRPLGITGEIGEVLAAHLLGLSLAGARQSGHDAVGKDGRRVQIKARSVSGASKLGQRVGSIQLKHKWDTVALILMNEDFEPIEVYEATRTDVERELLRPGSKSRNERGMLSVGKFKSIAKRCWPEPEAGFLSSHDAQAGDAPKAR